MTGAHVAVGAEVLHERVVVRREERATRDVRGQVTQHCARDGGSVISRSAASQFVHEHERVARGVLQDGGSLTQLHKERALACND